ncbi:MAA3, partial [Symbiodinium microadriaticum]
MAKAKDQNTSLKSSLGGSCSALGFRSYDAKEPGQLQHAFEPRRVTTVTSNSAGFSRLASPSQRRSFYSCN